MAHVDRVSLLLISMVPYSEIEKQMGAEWMRPRAYVRQVIQFVHDGWAEAATLLADTRRHQIRGGFEALYNKCVALGEMNAAVRAMTELGKLDGCYAPEQVRHDHNITGQVGVGLSLGALGFKGPEEVRERVEYLRAQLAEHGPRALGGSPAQVAAVAQAHLGGFAPDNHADVIDAHSVDRKGSP